jgi:hypothetical protein
MLLPCLVRRQENNCVWAEDHVETCTVWLTTLTRVWAVDHVETCTVLLTTLTRVCAVDHVET